MKIKYLSGLLLLSGALFVAACSDDDDYYASTTPIVTSVTTGDALVTATTAQIPTGTVTSLKGANAASYTVGVVYSTADDPTQGGTMVEGTYADDTISATLSGLQTGVTYHYATYVCLQNRVYKYGDVKTLVTTQAVAHNADATDISYTRATFAPTFSGPVAADGATTGFKIARTADKQVLLDGIDYQPGNAAGAWPATIKGLLPGTTYYYVPYIKLGNGYVMGEVKELTTKTQDMEYVDMGLSVLWAKFNLGAEAEEEAGTYFGYGDATGQQLSTDLADYPSQDISDTEFDITNGVTIDGTSPMLSAMPTLDQVKELINNTSKKIETVNGVRGIRFTAANGNSIFLPYTGYRDGAEFIEDGKAFYWTGSVSKVNSAYANTLTFDDNVVKNGNSLRYYGIPLRTVRPYAELKPNGTGALAVGDLENNGRIRIEIYNEYGSTKGNSVIDPSSVKFNQNMVVTFKLSGLNDNYKASAAKSNVAGLEFADASWDPSRWSSLSGEGDDARYDANVTGDGTYTVWMETGGNQADGAVVFCIDINNLANDLVDASKVKAEIVSIKLDADVTQPVRQDLVSFGNKDGNGTDGRIEIYNEYGTSGASAQGYYNNILDFTGNMAVNFTISGIDGNLKDGATKNYRTELSFADQDWNPSYWGGSSFGQAHVTGDGTYTVFYTFNAECKGAVVWTIELYDLWKDLVDPTKVKVTVNSVTTPCKN